MRRHGEGEMVREIAKGFALVKVDVTPASGIQQIPYEEMDPPRVDSAVE